MRVASFQRDIGRNPGQRFVSNLGCWVWGSRGSANGLDFQSRRLGASPWSCIPVPERQFQRHRKSIMDVRSMSGNPRTAVLILLEMRCFKACFDSGLTPRSTGPNSQCRTHPSIVPLSRLHPAFDWLLGRLTAFVRPQQKPIKKPTHMQRNLLLLLLGFLLLVYSYACFFKPKWVRWLSVSPVLEERNPLTPFMHIVHGAISGIIGVKLVSNFFVHVFSLH